ncbi:MAG: hypothetical protein FJ145_15435 [Deltaproteobacteria bacterium]|nr:hypothetical protein [Deltaproteobacteria bacterium]
MQLIIGKKDFFLRAALLGALAVSSSVQAATPGRPAAKDANVSWSLAGREGECTSLDVLKKKFPDLGEVKSPYQMADKLKAKGLKAEVKEHWLGKRPSVEVRVPDKDVYVMFVKTDLCGRK